MAEGAQASQQQHRHPRKRKIKIPARPANMVVLAEHQAFARSFDEFFACGMSLIDEVQIYFNRPAGKAAAEAAPAALYARARKRLGAAVMQMAAWLWLERALRDGDIDPAAAARQKKNQHFVILPPAGAAEAGADDAAAQVALPAEFHTLYGQVAHFIGRIQLMDKEMDGFSRNRALPPRNPLGGHWQALESAFGELERRRRS